MVSIYHDLVTIARRCLVHTRVLRQWSPHGFHHHISREGLEEFESLLGGDGEELEVALGPKVGDEFLDALAALLVGTTSPGTTFRVVTATTTHGFLFLRYFTQ